MFGADLPVTSDLRDLKQTNTSKQHAISVHYSPQTAVAIEITW